MERALRPAPCAVTLGDPAGVGPEVTAKAWVAAQHDTALPAFFAVGDAATLGAVWDGPVERITSTEAASAVFRDALPVWHVEDSGPLTLGQPTADGATCALHSLEMGVGLTRTESVRALVTGPVSKHQLHSVGYTHPGQTEFIAERCGITHGNAVMMLAAGNLRVVPITIHVPLADVSRLLTQELIVARARGVWRGLQRNFGIDAPRIAIAGMNPHAGESGDLGREEIDIMAPAIAELAAEGISIDGPVAADTLFAPHIRCQYDAILCAYHDQALVPFKALAFSSGVNLTLGLPIVRTSPDHGTAFNIAGQNIADPGPMIAALVMAAEIADARAHYQSCC